MLIYRLCCLLGVAVGLTVCFPRIRRFAFTSRGWGASGTPWQSSIVGVYPKIKYRSALPPSISPQMFQPINNFPSGDNPDLNDLDSSYTSSTSQSAPQLFISFGWGPLG